MESFSRHMSLMVLAVLEVSFLEWTKTSTWFLPACSITLSYTTSFITYSGGEGEREEGREGGRERGREGERERERERKKKGYHLSMSIMHIY